jgi:hypothetical protein
LQNQIAPPPKRDVAQPATTDQLRDNERRDEQ